MITSVVLRHDVLRRIPKILGVTIGMASLFFGLITYWGAQDAMSGILQNWTKTLLQTMIFINATFLLMTSEAGLRCRIWELGLPVKGRLWWQSHYFSLLLGGTILILVYSFIPLSLLMLGNEIQEPHFPDLVRELGKVFGEIIGLPFLMYVLALDILVLWFPASAQPGNEKSWRLRLGILLGSLVILLILVSYFELALLLFFPLGAIRFLHARIRIPDALSITQKPSKSHGMEKWSSVKTNRGDGFIVHLTMMKMLFKWPVNWLFLMPFIGFFGMLLGGFNPITGDPESMRFSNFYMCVYIMIAGAGHFTEKMHLLDFLPINRRTMLAWLVWPSALMLAMGYGLGQWQASVHFSDAEAISFFNTESDYGLNVPPPSYKTIKAVEAPLLTAPWGESHQAESHLVMKGLPWLLYNPYTTPEGASEHFVAWQIHRAVQVVYGEELSPEEVSQRYLETDNSGRVQVQGHGLSLKRDHEAWAEKSVGPIFPLLYGMVVIPYLLLLSCQFFIFHWQVSLKKQRIVFWTIMGILLTLHIGNLSTFMAGWTDEWIIRGAIFGAVQSWWASASSASALAYGVLLFLTGVCWLLALEQFRRLEPPRG